MNMHLKMLSATLAAILSRGRWVKKRYKNAIMKIVVIFTRTQYDITLTWIDFNPRMDK